MSIQFTDEQLLNAAALGIGAAHAEDTPAGKRIRDALDGDDWNPLENTDQALDLATAHKMKIVMGEGAVCVSFVGHAAVDDINKDPAAALRRAIVTVAAGGGKK